MRKQQIEDFKIGAWLSAAIEDPEVCDEMKLDIETWFISFEPLTEEALEKFHEEKAIDSGEYSSCLFSTDIDPDEDISEHNDLMDILEYVEVRIGENKDAGLWNGDLERIRSMIFRD